jgi:CTP synthase
LFAVVSDKGAAMTRYIFVTGGVVSSLGKGLAAAALGSVLQARGFTVRLRKLDPYLNVDPGTMSPYQHGEVFVTDDGAETDLDLGHYERFTNVPATRKDNVTAGQIYENLLKKERRGDFLGDTIQVIPHVTDAIKAFVTDAADGVDFMICEIGGTVGDIEGLPFFEAIRQLGQELGRERAMFIHVTLLPFIRAAGEMKTKPTQHSVKELRSIGIQPQILLCRCEQAIPREERRKLALFCNVQPEDVIEARDADTIYAVPLAYHHEGLDARVLAHFGVESARPDVSAWENVVRALREPDGEVTIAIVGKYVQLPDAYKSLLEALTHGGIANGVKVNIRWLSAEIFETGHLPPGLSDAHGILVPGGFGERGAEGKIRAIQFARERHIPFFGICFGMQLAVIETARNRANLPNAGSSEFGNPDPVIVGLMEEWSRGNQVEKRSTKSHKGGTMRLGSYPALLTQGSLACTVYGETRIEERHRHRWEVDVTYLEALKAAGMVVSGLSPDGILPEIIEIPDHPWFIGVQFHPELKSRPFAPHPLFVSFVAAAKQHSRLI